MTLSALLTDATQRLIAAGIPEGEARTEARILVMHAFGLTREQLILRSDSSPLAPNHGGKDAVAFEELLARRMHREPLAYILGERGFYGLSFHVTPAVLIPRPETELLVEAALEKLRGHNVPQLADIGTGSGCIAIAIAKTLETTNAHATDISAGALAIARANDARHNAGVTFFEGDLLAPLPKEKTYHVIVSNPPYIALTEASTLEPEVGVFEPHTALFDPSPSGDGLTLYRRLASEAPERLLPGGWLMVEVGQGQAEAVAKLFTDAGLTGIEVRNDLAGIPRVVLGQTKKRLQGR